MAFETEYKGVRITIFPLRLAPKRWSWEFSAGDLPMCRNDDGTLNSEQAAIDEALSVAKNLIDRS